jgi:hypothetical protein
MDIDILQKRLEIWKHILFILVGASFTLLLQAFLNYQESGSLVYPTTWYGVWFVVQLAAFLPGFVLLWGRHWAQIPLLERFNTIFGHFAVTWFTFVPVGIRVEPYSPKTFNYLWLGFGVALVVCYGWLRRKTQGMRNEIFP